MMSIMQLTPWKANGGEVLPLENQADLKIVDHAKKEALPGTYVTLQSYAINALMTPKRIVTPIRTLRSPYVMALWKI